MENTVPEAQTDAFAFLNADHRSAQEAIASSS